MTLTLTFTAWAGEGDVRAKLKFSSKYVPCSQDRRSSYFTQSRDDFIAINRRVGDEMRPRIACGLFGSFDHPLPAAKRPR
ncbi:putative SWI/SNF-related matrix-associated actin-dependent regulator [Fusarium oxysporum f. sp. albedinis]|nr:putative SWI/SNF-related matrix-associated actin-dependent regulator [Fusarium oxysporum f. sp. albedinis]